MDKYIERLFRFIEMIGITALIKAVVAPVYPIAGAAAASLLTAAASAYLILPVYEYCLDAIGEGSKNKKAIVVGTIISCALFVFVQVTWLNPLVATISDLIKTTISPAAPVTPSVTGVASKAAPD
jgi:hypothetical protein